MKIVITKKFKSLVLYTNKRQNIKTFRYDWKMVDRNCHEYGMCLVYGELTLLSGKTLGSHFVNLFDRGVTIVDSIDNYQHQLAR